MVGPDRVGIAHRQAGNVDQRQAMVLVVIRQEAQPVVAEHHSRREDRLIPLGHRFELPGPQHEMSEFGRADWLRDGAELAHRSYVVHRSPSCSEIAAGADGGLLKT